MPLKNFRSSRSEALANSGEDTNSAASEATKRLAKLTLCAALSVILLTAQTGGSSSDYHFYAGSTHAHTSYTWSHGEQFVKSDCSGIKVYAPQPGSTIQTWTDGYVKSKDGCAGIYVIDGAQYPSPNMTVKPDWKEYQGTPLEHFRLAKSHGYDWYVTTDHSQEAAFQPPGATNPQWMDTKRAAAETTNADFVALAGFEFSENDGPGGTGHINVINTSGMLNALAPGIDLPYFYKWLATALPNGEGPVVASFNHPTPDQYNNWDYRDPKVTDVITMLEVINSNDKIHYPAFLNALDHGWKVSPVCGNDNHGTSGIAKNTSRTIVLAKAKTKADILDAMKHRRTYATLDTNLRCAYTVNGQTMGSTLDRPASLHFDISLSDPDTGNPKDKITRIDIVKDGGKVAQEFTGAPAYSVHWTPVIEDSASKYFFVRVWTAGGGDAPSADPSNPVAWLAPVWTGR
jgi:hypothetical protein